MTVTGARSFRDPDGCVVRCGSRILRSVAPQAVGSLRDFLSSQTAIDLTARGDMVGTWEIREVEGPGAWFEHERIPFPSYPYEWSPAMLQAAARLTAGLALRLHKDGLGLKDATPYNVLFKGPKPVFVDLLSVERRTPGDPVWRPYAQFASTFLLPLALNRRLGLPIRDLLIMNRDGIPPELAWRLLPLAAKLRFPFRSLVTFPELLSRMNLVKQSHYQPGSTTDPERASFTLAYLYRRLQRQVERLAPDPESQSHWTGYLGNLSYAPEEFEIKARFVSDALTRTAPATVLDVGCNTGFFSLDAARKGAEVVAIDYDEAVVDRVWRAASAQNLNVLPLVVNLARPTPALGWRDSECQSFLDRAHGRFDLVLMLAVIHHMMVTERIPLDEVLRLAADLTRRAAVIEYVDPRDPMFRQIARGRDHLHSSLTVDAFVAAAERYFAVEHSVEVNPTRRLFLLRKK